MLAVAHLPVMVVEEKVAAANQHLAADRQIGVTLINGPRSVVVSGHPQSLYGLQVLGFIDIYICQNLIRKVLLIDICQK